MCCLFFIRISVIAVLTPTAFALDLEKSKLKASDSNSTSSSRKWISELFHDAENTFHAGVGVSDKCREDIELWKLYLLNQTVWAVQMLESSEWPSVGLFAGMTHHMGNWRECVSLSAPEFKGQYCLVETTYNFTLKQPVAQYSPHWTNSPDGMSSIWNVIKMYEQNPMRKSRHKYTWALCVPSSCTVEDVKMSVNDSLYPMFEKHGFDLTVNVNPASCGKQEDRKFSTGFYYTCALLVAILLLVVLATIYDVRRVRTDSKETENVLLRLFSCFSILKNCQSLSDYKPTAVIPPIFMTKVITMSLILIGHRILFFFGFPTFDTERLEMKYYDATCVQSAATGLADIFFMISGFLTFHFGFEPMRKGGVFHLVVSVLVRWLRMIPVLGLIILFVVNILPYMGEGPYWNHQVLREAEYCRINWWVNMVSLTNMVNSDKQCLLMSWFVAVDIQLSMIGGILLLIFAKNERYGLYSSVGTFLLTELITVTIVWQNRYYGILRLVLNLLEEPRKYEEYYKFYTATYLRLAPYMVGFLAAYVTKILKDRMIKFTLAQQLPVLILTCIVGFGQMFFGMVLYMVGRPYYHFENAVIAAFYRPLFVLPSAVIFCMYITSGLGVLNKLVDQKIFIPYGRLTYCVYVVNTVLQLLHSASQKTYMPSSTSMNIYWWAISDIVLSFFIAFLLYVISEGPLIGMTKLMVDMMIRTNKKTPKAVNKVKIDYSIENGYSKDPDPQKLPIEMCESENSEMKENGNYNTSFTFTEGIQHGKSELTKL